MPSTKKIIALKTKFETKRTVDNQPAESTNNEHSDDSQPSDPTEMEYEGRIFFNTSAGPQDIAYPPDLNLLNNVRGKLEELIDIVYIPTLNSCIKRRNSEQI